MVTLTASVRVSAAPDEPDVPRLRRCGDLMVARSPALDGGATLSNTAVSAHSPYSHLKDQRPSTRPAVLARSATLCNTIPAIWR